MKAVCRLSCAACFSRLSNFPQSSTSLVLLYSVPIPLKPSSISFRSSFPICICSISGCLSLFSEHNKRIGRIPAGLVASTHARYLLPAPAGLFILPTRHHVYLRAICSVPSVRCRCKWSLGWDSTASPSICWTRIESRWR